MTNAWFLYLAPIAIGAVFLVGGFVLFRRFAKGGKDEETKTGVGSGCAGVAIMLIGGTVALGVLISSPSPPERQRRFDLIFRTPPDQITMFVIRHGRDQTLVTKPVLISEPGRVRAIADVLRQAREVSANHPQTGWTASLEIVTKRNGAYIVRVLPTTDGRNGTLVGVGSNREGGGWQLGYFRADGLERLLEDAASAAGAKNKEINARR
jgi:hypothetical protein